MLNKARHQLIMKQILEGIYKDVSLASCLGFKGGTAAWLFYGLPRFSVDLDFDLLTDDPDGSISEQVRDKIKAIMAGLGAVKKADIKRYTIFLLLSYGDADHNVKVEISRRRPPFLTGDYFEFKDHLGISIRAATPAYIFAAKLAALTTRREFAARDMFDIHYFAKNRWDVDQEVLKYYVGKSLKEYLPACIKFVEKINDNEILAGLGELLNDKKQKAWVKNNLRQETAFLLKNYLSALE